MQLLWLKVRLIDAEIKVNMVVVHDIRILDGSILNVIILHALEAPVINSEDFPEQLNQTPDLAPDPHARYRIS